MKNIITFCEKYDKSIFYILLIGSIITGVLGIYLAKLWIFMIGFSMTACIIFIGIFFKFCRKYKK